MKVPGDLIEAAFAVISAAGHEEGDSYAKTICNISLFYCSVIHLQMQNPFFYFLSSALIPVLGSNIAASSASYVHG